MKRFLAILMLLAVLGCGEPTSEEYLEFWIGMYIEAAKDVDAAQTLEARVEASSRMGRYEYEMNRAAYDVHVGRGNE